MILLEVEAWEITFYQEGWYVLTCLRRWFLFYFLFSNVKGCDPMIFNESKIAYEDTFLSYIKYKV